jgi:hypothetical protein
VKSTDDGRQVMVRKGFFQPDMECFHFTVLLDIKMYTNIHSVYSMIEKKLPFAFINAKITYSSKLIQKLFLSL